MATESTEDHGKMLIENLFTSVVKINTQAVSAETASASFNIKLKEPWCSFLRVDILSTATTEKHVKRMSEQKYFRVIPWIPWLQV